MLRTQRHEQVYGDQLAVGPVTYAETIGDVPGRDFTGTTAKVLIGGMGVAVERAVGVTLQEDLEAGTIGYQIAPHSFSQADWDLFENKAGMIYVDFVAQEAGAALPRTLFRYEIEILPSLA